MPTKKASGKKPSGKKPSGKKAGGKQPSAKKAAATKPKLSSDQLKKRTSDARAKLADANQELAAVHKRESRLSQQLTSDGQRARNVKKSIAKSEQALSALTQHLTKAKAARKQAKVKLDQLRP